MKNQIEVFVEQHQIKLLAVLCLIAFGLGAGGLYLHAPSPSGGETVSWWGIAVNLSRGYGYSLCNQYYFPFCNAVNTPTAMREAAPVLLFSAIARLTNESLFAACLMELAIYVGVSVAVFFMTRAHAGPSAGVLAALIWAAYPRAISLIPQLSGDLLAAFTLTLGTFFVQRARKTGQTRDWLLAGSGLGLAILSRSVMLVVGLAIIGGLAIERRRFQMRFWDRMRPSILILLTITALLTPWMVRTKLVFGRTLIGSSLVGYNIYRQNYMLGSNDYLRNVGTDEGWHAVQALVARRTDLSGHENEAQMDLVYREEGIKIIAANPVHYLILSGYRFFMLWFDWRVSEAFGYKMGFREYAMMAIQAILMILALLGLRGRLKEFWPFWAGIGMVTLAYMAVNSRLHYIVPLMPLVISLAAGKLFPKKLAG
jgi:hypothetical protein